MTALETVKGITTRRERQRDDLLMAMSVDADDPEFKKARIRLVDAQIRYDLALTESGARHEEWKIATSEAKSGSDLVATQKGIRDTRTIFKKHLMENADENGTFESAYFTTGRDDKFKKFRDDISDAIVAHDRAIKAHSFDSHTIPEFDLWNIAEKRVTAHWHLVEAATEEISVLANLYAIKRFAQSEGMANEASDVIAVAYYAKYPERDRGPFGLSGKIVPSDVQRESEIVARITGDKDMAKPMTEYCNDLREKESQVSQEKRESIHKQTLADDKVELARAKERVEAIKNSD